MTTNDELFFKAAHMLLGGLNTSPDEPQCSVQAGNRYYEFIHDGYRVIVFHERMTVIDAAVGDDRKQGSTWVPLQAILIERHGGDAFEPPYAASPAEYEQALCLLASRLEDALRYIRENPESWKELAQRYNVSPEKI